MCLWPYSDAIYRILKRHKRVDQQSLLQGVSLVEHMNVASIPLPSARERPTSPKSHSSPLQIQEHENREGQWAAKSQKKPKKSSVLRGKSPAPQIEVPQHWPYWSCQWSSTYSYPWYPMPQTPAPPPPPPPPPATTEEQPVRKSRQHDCGRRKTQQEDEQRRALGIPDPPRKRKVEKERLHYHCTQCGKYKSKETGHSQLRGKWYCPSSGETLVEWRAKR